MNNMAISNIKNLILSAAVKQFLARGYSGARMQAIADKAGINKALLHYHFSSKEKLYHAVLRDQFASFIESLIELFLREEDFEPWLRRLIAKLLREFSSRPQFSRFIIWEWNSHGKELPRIFAEVLAQSKQGAFLQRIDSRLRQYGLQNYPPQQFLMNILSLCIYPGMAQPLLEQVMGKEVFSDPNFIGQREEEIFRLIKYGIFLRTGGEK